MDRRNFLRAAAAAAASSVAAVPALAQGSMSDPPGTMPPRATGTIPRPRSIPIPPSRFSTRASRSTAAVRPAWCASGPAASGPRDRYGSATSSG